MGGFYLWRGEFREVSRRSLAAICRLTMPGDRIEARITGLPPLTIAICPPER
jgi:hypothetical protein